MARPEKVVIDASVAIKWYVDENWTPEARQIINDYRDRKKDIATVTLMPYEVLNALRYSPESSIVELITVAESLEKLNLDQYNLEGELAKKTLENAHRYGITVYDSSYLSLGEILDATVYTADEKLIRKAQDTCLKPVSHYTT